MIMGVGEAVAGGDQRKSLEAIRDALASQLDVSQGAAAAAVARELRAVLADIAGLPDEKGEAPLDVIVANVAQLDEHRRSRRPKATGS